MFNSKSIYYTVNRFLACALLHMRIFNLCSKKKKQFVDVISLFFEKLTLTKPIGSCANLLWAYRHIISSLYLPTCYCVHFYSEHKQARLIGLSPIWRTSSKSAQFLTLAKRGNLSKRVVNVSKKVELCSRVKLSENQVLIYSSFSFFD